MKRLLIIIFSMISGCALGQYMPGSAQPFQLAPLYNPAFTGIENFNDFKFSYRYQWAAFKENAPQFANLSYTFRIKQPLDLKVNSIRTSRTDFTRIVPKIRLNAQGLGFNVFSDKFGPMERIGGGAHYAIHIPLSEKIFVSAGVGAAAEMTRINGKYLDFGEFADADIFRDKLESGSGNHTELWTRAGLLVYGKHFYVGGAYFPYNKTLTKSEVEFSDPFYKGNFQGGVSFNLNEDFVVKPSIFALWTTAGDFLIDYSAKFYLQDRAWFGLTYRDVKAGVGSAGFRVNEKFSVSYSFEFSMGELRTFTGSSHDVVVAIRFKNLKRVNQYTW